MDLELGGKRPKPLQDSAIEAIDEHRALLHGCDAKEEIHSSVININDQVSVIVHIINKCSYQFLRHGQ